MAYGNGRPRIGKQGTLESMGLDVVSRRRKSRPLRASEQAELQREGREQRIDLQARAEMQGRLGTEAPTGLPAQARTKRKTVKKARTTGDALRRQGVGY